MAAPDCATDRNNTPTSPPGSWLGPFRALRHRNYRLYFCGQMISLAGSWMQLSGIMWLAFHLTATSRWPALVAAAQMAPAFLLGAWGGSLADRFPRRWLVFSTQTALMLLALLLAGLTFADTVTVWLLLGISLAIGVVNAVDLPARLSFLSEMVEKDDLINAVGLNSLTFNLARFTGPLLLAWLLPLGGPELCFLLNALSFLAVMAALASMRLSPAISRSARNRNSTGLREAFRYVIRHPQLSVLMVLTSVTALFGWTTIALLPALARRLQLGLQGYSTLLSAVAVGALLAAFLVAALGTVERRWRFIGIGVGLASSALIGLSFAPTLLAAMACATLVGAGLVCFFATSQASFQLGATDRNRGRVMGIYSIVLAGANPLGNLITGPAADHWGEPVVLRFQGLAILGAGILVLARSRRRKATVPVAPQEQPSVVQRRAA